MRNVATMLVLTVCLGGCATANHSLSLSVPNPAVPPDPVSRCNSLMYRTPDPDPAAARECAYLLDAWQDE